eukprot:8648872-Lingulodinium_polyedra.AAC.2
MVTQGSLYSSHGPTNLPILRIRSGPELLLTSDLGSGPGRRPSSTPPRMRASQGAPYPPAPIPNGSGGDEHNVRMDENPSGPLEAMSPRLRETYGVREEELRSRTVRVAVGNGIQAVQMTVMREIAKQQQLRANVEDLSKEFTRYTSVTAAAVDDLHQNMIGNHAKGVQ